MLVGSLDLSKLMKTVPSLNYVQFDCLREAFFSFWEPGILVNLKVPIKETVKAMQRELSLVECRL